MSIKNKKDTFDSILSDETSGSTELLSNLNDYFMSIINDPEKIRKDSQTVKNELIDFTAIMNYIKQLDVFIDKNDKEGLDNFLKVYSKNTENTFNKIFENCVPYLKDKSKILTLSNSKTLFEIFKRLKKLNGELEITVCESDPAKEGIILAERLSKIGIKTKVIPDASMSQYIRKSDAVVIGADKILGNGNVVNKIGSSNAAIIAKYFKIPFLVLSAKEKFSSKKSYKIKKENPADILNERLKNLKIQNPYFEEIESNLITKIISD
ncbi:MAG TPA: hypothetical protein VKA26_10540 [Ignavibacteriaceae bacterium]|nr:hypothetical protein [Ignavibacteriaceae bacterium]